MSTLSTNHQTLKIPPIMFGGNVFGWTLDKPQSFRMLDMLFERGFRFIDTADVYGKTTGLSEEIIGQWIKERGIRQHITLATKGGRAHTKTKSGQIERGKNNAPTYLSQCLQNSLERLQTDYIDLYYTHFDDNVTPVDRVLETYRGFMQSGKVNHIGASNFSAGRLREALKAAKNEDLPKYSILQTEYNLVERREFETKLQPVCTEHRVKVAAYFSLASGFLTGKYRQKEDFKGTARQKYTEKYFTPQGVRVLAALDEISEEHKVSHAAVALAWLLHQPNIQACVVSATKEYHLNAFDEALNLKLTPKALQQLNTLVH